MTIIKAEPLSDHQRQMAQAIANQLDLVADDDPFTRALVESHVALLAAEQFWRTQYEAAHLGPELCIWCQRVLR